MKNATLELILSAFDLEIIKKCIFSRPESSRTKKVSARLCKKGEANILALEYTLPESTVSHKNVVREQLENELSLLISEYMQINLITTLGDAEYKRSKKGEIILGGDKLRRKMRDEGASAERAFDTLDTKKSYILKGDEPFLVRLGISDKSGRVHDKKQGKFRQINRFIEILSELYSLLPEENEISVYDLCSGKSYLSFAVYYYLTEIKGRRVSMLCADLKGEVMRECEKIAAECGFVGMRFICTDITALKKDERVDLVISLHACDVATDIVIDTAIGLSAGVILSTPCCHRNLTDKIKNPELDFISNYPHLKNKLAEVLTDAIRIARLKKHGYNVCALELTDPENTPKNTLIRAVRKSSTAIELTKYEKEYEKILTFVLGEGYGDYFQ